MKMKKLIPALAMLLVSAILLGTSTYAWFSMNTVVSATNMQIKAVADQGILINEVAAAANANWDNAATTSQTESINLHATSTANTGTWYVAYSTLSNDSASATAGAASANLTTDGYQVLGTDLTTANEVIDTNGGTDAAEHTITYVNSNGIAGYQNGEGYYVKYTYYIKSSGAAITTSTAANGQTFNIKSVSASGVTNTAALDAALRIAVVVDGKAYIYAPVASATTSYYVNASSTATTVLDHTTSIPTTLSTIPAVTADGTPVYVYVYFEGEDAGLKTANAVNTLDTLNVSIEFELKTNDTAVTANSGVTVS